METYKYIAMTENKERVSGTIEATNEMDAVAKVKSSYPIVVEVTSTADKSKASNLLSGEVALGSDKLNEKAFTLMCSQFAVILKAGIPIARTVRLISQKMSDRTLRKILNKVAEDVEAGRSLAESFADRGKGVLPVTFLETVHAGEEAGNLDTAFESASAHFTKQMKLKGKVRGALIYPIFVMVLAVLVVVVLMIKVVPTFTQIFEEQGSQLPAITRSLIAVSMFFRNYWFVLLAIVILIFVGIKIYGNSEEGRLNLAKISLKLPVLGNINVLNSASQFANTMAMMLGAGLPVTNAVSITSRTISNYFISKEVEKIVGELETGHTIGKSLKKSECLPDILVDMTAVGEESGELESTLTMTAEYYDTELEAATQAALAKLEPITLVFIGAVAGYIVIAIYMAMFSMYDGM